MPWFCYTFRFDEDEHVCSGMIQAKSCEEARKRLEFVYEEDVVILTVEPWVC